MNENNFSRRQKEGIMKMVSILVNMIQDHSIDDTYIIMNKEMRLKGIFETTKGLASSRQYDDYEKDFLNQVRNLVLSYKSGELKENYSQPWDI